MPLPDGRREASVFLDGTDPWSTGGHPTAGSGVVQRVDVDVILGQVAGPDLGLAGPHAQVHAEFVLTHRYADANASRGNVMGDPRRSRCEEPVCKADFFKTKPFIGGASPSAILLQANSDETY